MAVHQPPAAPPKRRRRRIAGLVALALLGLFVVIQLVPYGRDHGNPPVLAEPAWNAPATRVLAQRACFDCHSNEVRWPWYSHVAPVSWLVQHDVDEGRAVLNFSEWQRPQEEAGESAEALREGEMPPRIYPWMHGHARLSAEERAQLIAGLEATPGCSGGEGAGGAHEGGDDDEGQEHASLFR